MFFLHSLKILSFKKKIQRWSKIKHGGGNYRHFGSTIKQQNILGPRATPFYNIRNCDQCHKSFIKVYTMLNNYDPGVLYCGD